MGWNVCIEVAAGNKIRKFMFTSIFAETIWLIPTITTTTSNTHTKKNEQNTEKVWEKQLKGKMHELKLKREKEKKIQMEKMNPSNWLLWEPLAFAIIFAWESS